MPTPDTTHTFSLGKKILFALFPLFFLVLLLEIGFRFFPWHKETGKTIAGAVIPDKDLIWRLYPHQTGPYKTNDLGLRDTPFNSQADKKILLLGDSVSWGDGIEVIERTYPFILEQILGNKSGKTYEVINSAVLGYSTFQEYRYLQLYGLQYQPDLIVLQFCLNDVVERYSSLFEYGGDNTFMGIDTRLAIQGTYGWLLRNSRTFETGIRMLKFASRNEQAYRVEELTKEPSSREIESAWKQTLSEVGDIRALAEKEHIPLILVVFPYRFQLQQSTQLNQPQLRLKRYAMENKVMMIDLLPSFAAFQEKNKEVQLFFDANHMTIEGHQLAAEILSQQLFPTAL